MVPSTTKAPTCSSVEGRLGSITISINYSRNGQGLQVQDYPPDLSLPEPPLMMGAGGRQRTAACLSVFVVGISNSCHFQSYKLSFRKLNRKQAPLWLQFAPLSAPMLEHAHSCLGVHALATGKIISW